MVNYLNLDLPQSPPAPLSVYRGDSWSRQFALKDKDGQLFDFTGWSFRCQWRGQRGTVEELAVTEENSTLTVIATPAQTTAFAPQRLDIEGTTQVEGQDGEPQQLVLTWVRAELDYVEDVTR